MSQENVEMVRQMLDAWNQVVRVRAFPSWKEALEAAGHEAEGDEAGKHEGADAN